MSLRTSRRVLDDVDRSSKLMEEALKAQTEELNEWEPSPFALKIMEIAEQEDDFISNDTLRAVEDLMKPDKTSFTPQLYSGGSPMKAFGNENRTTGGIPIPQITPEQLADIKKVVAVVKKMAEVGKFVFSKSEKILKFLGPIGVTASVLMEVITFFEEKKPDPVMKELGEVKSQLVALSSRMTAQFNELKSFVVEHDFYEKYTGVISTLNKYMIDTLSGDSMEAVKLFESYYKLNSPQKMVYELMSKLENPDNNPLMIAMKADPLQLETTFERWSELLESVLSQALFIETFAAGLFGTSQHGQLKIVEKLAVYYDYVKNWEQYYLTTPNYWPEGVKGLMNDVHETKSGCSDQDKATFIKEKLKFVLTNDEFYVVCFGDHIWSNYVKNGSDLLVETRNDYNIVVYRSASNDTKRSEKMQKYFNANMKTYKKTVFSWFNHWSIVRAWNGNLQDGGLKKIADANPGFGLVMMVAQSRWSVAIDYPDIGSDYWWKGPGFYSFDGKFKADDGFGSEKFDVFWLFAQ